jgi:cobalt-zinc-cadmium efflux system protein
VSPQSSPVQAAQSHGAHAGRSHGVSADADRGKLTIALALIVGFMLVEVVVGALVHSLALLSDAAHMLTDAGAIALSLVAIRLAARPAKGAMTHVCWIARDAPKALRITADPPPVGACPG